MDSKVEYEVLFIQFSVGNVVTLEEAQDGHVVLGVGGGVEVVRDWEVLSSHCTLILLVLTLLPPCLQLELSSDSDSELELIDCPRHVRRPGIKRRRILDGTNVHAVPIYTGR
eukprot:g31595.t1